MSPEEKLKQETEQLLRTTAQPLYDTAGVLFAGIERRLVEVEQATGWTILRDSDDAREFVAFMDRTSIQLQCRWLQIYAKAEVVFRVVSGRMPMPRELRRGLLVSAYELSERGSRKLKLARVLEHGWCWEDSGRTLSTEALAEQIVEEFVSTRGSGGHDPWEAD